MNKGAAATLVAISLLLLNPSHLSADNADRVRRIEVAEGQVVTQEVPITPGFAALIEVPSEILSFTIADQTAFACDKTPPDLTKLLCKPLTASRYNTNIIVVTAKNEFNIILRVDDVGANHPFKYVFHDVSTVTHRPSHNETATPQSSGASVNLLDRLLDEYSYRKCSARTANAHAEIRCLDTTRIGVENYLRFRITSHSRKNFNVINVNIVIRTLGGFTGLSLKAESPALTEYVLENRNLRYGEEVTGIVKIPDLNLNENQRAVLTLTTDLGKSGDLILNDVRPHG